MIKLQKIEKLEDRIAPVYNIDWGSGAMFYNGTLGGITYGNSVNLVYTSTIYVPSNSHFDAVSFANGYPTWDVTPNVAPGSPDSGPHEAWFIAGDSNQDSSILTFIQNDVTGGATYDNAAIAAAGFYSNGMSLGDAAGSFTDPLRH